jgi:hypothetical protein
VTNAAERYGDSGSVGKSNADNVRRDGVRFPLCDG